MSLTYYQQWGPSCPACIRELDTPLCQKIPHTGLAKGHGKRPSTNPQNTGYANSHAPSRTLFEGVELVHSFTSRTKTALLLLKKEIRLSGVFSSQVLLNKLSRRGWGVWSPIVAHILWSPFLKRGSTTLVCWSNSNVNAMSWSPETICRREGVVVKFTFPLMAYQVFLIYLSQVFKFFFPLSSTTFDSSSQLTCSVTDGS